jgi:hypothetical protein
MAEVRDENQRQRAEARAGRRAARAEEPFEQLDEEARGESGSIVTPELKKAARTAAVAALTGSLAGAAKAVVDRRGGGDTPEDEERDEEQPEADASQEEADVQETEDEPDASEPTDEHDDDGQAEEDDDVEPAAEAAETHKSEPQTAASSGDVGSIIARAKQHAADVLGSEPETVSGIERENGNWRVNVEVVQMRRVPESTDVLATYGVVLDESGDLISLQELRRYRRSQADDDR